MPRSPRFLYLPLEAHGLVPDVLRPDRAYRRRAAPVLVLRFTASGLLAMNPRTAIRQAATKRSSDMWKTILATDMERGMMLDDDRFPHVMHIGHLRVGPKWVTAWSFHPDAGVYPNTPYKVRVNDSVRILT
jgi:hypothetical protein